MPDSITSIVDSAFFCCTGLTSIKLPASLTSIGYWAFYGCSGLTSIELPASLNTIIVEGFSCCTGLTSVTFQNPEGWKAGSTAITETELSDPATAATLLTDTYVWEVWSRS